MASDEAQDAAAVFDFLDEFLRDIERGTRLPLTHYLARYKGHEEAVGAESFADLARAGLAASTKPPSSNGELAPGSVAEADPERVGPYRLLRELGRGGQGAVWLAEDTRIARRVALKLLPAEFAALSTERRKRLQREAEVIARLDHPCLCAVLDARIDGERPYIAMRFVEGGTLGEAIVRAREARKAEHEGNSRVQGPLRMAPRTAIELAGLLTYFERAARALHAAHEAGVVHRDVKPQNLMVTRAGDPVVLDFGQARDETSDSFELTRSGDVLGTPAYMSPEQILGRRDGVDRRTDVWSLGTSLFEALTLARPFEAENVPALFLAIRGARLPDPRSLNAALPADLSLVVATALEKEPKLRYATALDFAEDLRRVREYEPVRAKPPSAWRVFQSWFQRHPALAYGTLGSFVALSIGLASTLVLLGKNERLLAWKGGLLLGHQADKLIQADPSAALAWGIEAVEAAPSFETRVALFRALQACHLRSMIDASPANQALDCALAPDGRAVAIGLDNDGVRICDLETGKARLVVRPDQKLPKGETREVRDVDYSPDGTQLAFVTQHKPSDDAAIAKDGASISPPPAKAHLADARTGGALCEFDLLPGEARAVEFLARGATLLALSDGGALATGANGAEIWRWGFPAAPTPEREARMIVSAASERALVWSADKRKLGASRAWL
ncbi:MAG TPA: serine/threonine-protein kinase, partial [Planctomycetota bacterium]|nr:serine/threonine-protein kinase [Planctomycetota bacterium]